MSLCLQSCTMSGVDITGGIWCYLSICESTRIYKVQFFKGWGGGDVMMIIMKFSKPSSRFLQISGFKTSCRFLQKSFWDCYREKGYLYKFERSLHLFVLVILFLVEADFVCFYMCVCDLIQKENVEANFSIFFFVAVFYVFVLL